MVIFNQDASVLGDLTINPSNGAGNILTMSGTNIVTFRTPSEILTDIGVTGVYQLLSEKGVANGYAPLDSSSKIPITHLPSLAISETSVVASQAAMLLLTAQTGDIAIRTDENKSYILAGTDPTVLGDWQELLTPTDAVQTVNGLLGTVQLDLGFTVGTGDITLTGGAGINIGITSTDTTNWNTAFGWGDHAGLYLPTATVLPATKTLVANQYFTSYDSATGLFTSAQPSYSGLSGIPATFTPSAHTLDSHSNVTITANSAGEILKWSGTAWINNTLAEAGISAVGHTHTFASLTSKPTTIAGYGITDAYTKTESDNKYLLNTTDTLTGDLIVTGLGTFGNIQMSAANPFILGNVTSGIFSLASDNSILVGSGIKLYSSTHATQANDIEFTSDGNVAGSWDDSTNTWTFAGTGTFSGTGDSSFAGNVGIGTATPNRKLHVQQAVETVYPTLGTAFGSTLISGDTGLYGLYIGINTFTGITSIQNMRNDSAVAYDLLLQPVGGNLGIGTTSPSTRLNVKFDNLSSSTQKNEVVLDSLSTGAGTHEGALTGITFNNRTINYTSGSFNSTAGVYGVNLDPLPYGRFMGLSFYTSTLDSTATEKMRIDESGNVGIGNSTPSYKLDVSGTGRFTGDVIVPDEAYGVGWSGSLEVPTKNAVYDKIETIVAGTSSSGIINYDNTATSLIASGTEIVRTYTLPANTLSVNGDSIKIKMFATAVNNGNNKGMSILINEDITTTSFGATNSFHTSTLVEAYLEATITRLSSTTYMYQYSLNSYSVSGGTSRVTSRAGSNTGTTTWNLSKAIDLRISGMAAGDVTYKNSIIEIVKAI